MAEEHSVDSLAGLRRKIDAGETVALLHTRRGAGILLGEANEREQVEN